MKWEACLKGKGNYRERKKGGNEKIMVKLNQRFVSKEEEGSVRGEERSRGEDSGTSVRHRLRTVNVIIR